MKKLSWKEVKENFPLIKEVLLSCGTIAYPTDTIYGLGGNFLRLEVHQKVFQLKRRAEQPFSAAVANCQMLEMLVEIDGRAEKFIKHLPGPYTFVLKMRKEIREAINWPLETIGLRWIDLPELNDLINYLGFPLITTSVNISGQPPLNDPEEISRTFPEIDLLIEGKVSKNPQPSTVVELSGERPRILRAGANHEKILALLEKE